MCVCVRIWSGGVKEERSMKRSRENSMNFFISPAAESCSDIVQRLDGQNLILKKVSNKSSPSNLTEHGHVLPGIEVPVAPVSPVAVQGCVLLMIVSWFCPKGVDHANMTSV